MNNEVRELTLLALAGVIVLALIAPWGIAAERQRRQQRQPLYAPPQVWRKPWGLFDILLVTALLYVIPATLVELGVDLLAAPVVALPLQWLLLGMLRAVLLPGVPLQTEDRWRWWPSGVALAFRAWLVLTPTALGLNALIHWIYTELGASPQEHPLSQVDASQFWNALWVVLQACVAAPFVEELLFRGMLLPWLLGGRDHRGLLGRTAEPRLPVRWRPWVVWGLVLLLAASSSRYEPLVFAVILIATYLLMQRTWRRHRRSRNACFASAALFAMVHVGVWPTPIPLLLLGVGWGWLALRTRRILIPVIAHGTFNAVSAVFIILRGILEI